MPVDLHNLTALLRAGRFADVVSAVRQNFARVTDSKNEHLIALHAEALQLTGDNRSAADLIEALLKFRGIQDSTLARCHIVLGNISRDCGDLAKAFSHFGKAFQLSERAHNAELVCWAKLRLMAVAGERDGPAAAIAMLSDVRNRITAIGDPILLATLHLWVAEFETKRGLLLSAERHVQSGRTILNGTGNVWLRGSAAIDDFCISFLRSDIDSALLHVTEALEAASLSGHAMTKMAACTNLAHIHLTHGDLATAERYFKTALDCCHPGGANEDAVLDGLAQLELARGDLSRCEDYLNQIGRVEHLTRPKYYESWSFRTRVQLLIRQGRIPDGIKFLEGVRTDEFHPALRVTLRTLHADLRAASGDLNSASELIHSAYSEYDGQSPDVLAQIERTLGRILGGVSERELSACHLQRALRVLTAVNNIAARSEAACDFFSSTNRINDLTARETLKPPPNVTRARDSARVIDHVATLTKASEQPNLLGLEMIDLVAHLDCANRVELRAVAIEQTKTRLTASKKSTADADYLQTSFEIPLGDTRETTYFLTITPKADLASRLTCTAVYQVLSALMELKRLKAETAERSAIWPPEDYFVPGDAVFASRQMLVIAKTIQKVAPSDLTVLITGETGTGKEILARTVHDGSRRAHKPFVPFNCAAVPRDLVESQLFGYRRGAFSGAHDHFPGVIRAATEGTLFLDEIGEIAQDVQPKLLRFLEYGEIHPLGEPKPIKVDVRVVAASNADLEQLVTRGHFREDLFYRLNVIRFKIPALRDRREEIPILVDHFCRKSASETGKPHVSVAEDTMEYLVLYDWPGNIRQLANEVKRFIALAENGAVITPQHLSPEIASTRKTVSVANEEDTDSVLLRLDQSLSSAMEHLERSMLRHALKKSQGRLEPAAKDLGISRKGLYLKRQRWGLELSH